METSTNALSGERVQRSNERLVKALSLGLIVLFLFTIWNGSMQFPGNITVAVVLVQVVAFLLGYSLIDEGVMGVPHALLLGLVQVMLVVLMVTNIAMYLYFHLSSWIVPAV